MDGDARVVRFATSNDVSEMLEIYRPLVESSWTSFEMEVPSPGEFTERLRRTQESDPWLVAEIDGRLAGYAYSTAFRGRAAYFTTRETTVYVRPDLQRQGIGSDLMNRLLDELVVLGIRRAVAAIALPNDSSVALHESVGFVHVGTFSQVGHKFGIWRDVGFWEADLAARSSIDGVGP